MAGRTAGYFEKLHLVALRHHMKAWSTRSDARFLDFGTDYTYPFYADYSPTVEALAALGDDRKSARHYPSSYGTDLLRKEVTAFINRQFGVTVRADTEVMISPGASQIFDAVSRTYAGRYVLLPELALPTVNTIATGNGAEVVRVPFDECGRPSINEISRLVTKLGRENIRFLYVNSPMNPTGVVLRHDYFGELVDLARRDRFAVIHDHDSWFTSHDGRRAPNILEVEGATEVAITVLSVSKELGLPGLRVGAVAGASELINMIRIHNSEFCVMIPEFVQNAAATALKMSSDPSIREHVQRRISDSLQTTLKELKGLGWPHDAIWPPVAGYKFMFTPPKAFGDYDVEGVSGVELFDFFLASEAGVKLSTSRSFNADRRHAMRMVLMQNASEVREAFERMERAGISYSMPVPDQLHDSFVKFAQSLDFWDL
ncbi:pyridoxal phosphate-dependent aminotransferase [Nocardia salmonicida]|uniref:pyridoxal phosphate-dependent aminotransferase n=1 Tax=Nocardia salmonicida TaxID=53431 RepID=UPI0012F4C869|nr:pyridoxal phosphate-dependent aminotransferase [Nocardia sp.]